MAVVAEGGGKRGWFHTCMPATCANGTSDAHPPLAQPGSQQDAAKYWATDSGLGTFPINYVFISHRRLY